MTFSWLFVVTVLAAALAIYDGVIRVRQRRRYWFVASFELIFAVATLVSLAPCAQEIHQLAPTFLLIVQFLLLLLMSTRRRRLFTAVAFVLTFVVVLVVLEFVNIPGFA